MTISHTDPKIVVALDYASAAPALALAAQLDPALCRVKVGKELFTAAGPALVEQLVDQGFGVFLDLKFHDIPNTVAKACEAASRLGVWMLNVHASGGSQMMQAAREGVSKSGQSPLLIAVTVLTSMNQAGLQELGITTPLEQHVLHLARLTQAADLDGVVCSAQEAPVLRQALGADFKLVTPGIRPAQALQLGASYLVIGRPITQAANPLHALQEIHVGIAHAG